MIDERITSGRTRKSYDTPASRGDGLPNPSIGLSKMSLAALVDLGMSRSRIAAYAKLSPDEVQDLMRDYDL